MDFQKEFEDLKKVWSERTTTGKIILIFAFGLSAMSVGSIADTVFEFKGFILNGIEFYRDISEPIRFMLINFLNIKISQLDQDFFTLSALSISLMIKAVFSNKHTNYKGLFFGSLGIFAIILLLVLVLMFYVLFRFNFSQAISIMLIFLIFPLIFGVINNKGFRLDQIEKYVFFHLIALFLFVAIIAAISEGLMRPVT